MNCCHCDLKEISFAKGVFRVTIWRRTLITRNDTIQNALKKWKKYSKNSQQNGEGTSENSSPIWIRFILVY